MESLRLGPGLEQSGVPEDLQQTSMALEVGWVTFWILRGWRTNSCQSVGEADLGKQLTWVQTLFDF